MKDSMSELLDKRLDLLKIQVDQEDIYVFSVKILTVAEIIMRELLNKVPPLRCSLNAIKAMDMLAEYLNTEDERFREDNA